MVCVFNSVHIAIKVVRKRFHFPPLRHLSLQHLIPHHLPSGTFVWPAIGIREVELNKPIIVQGFGHGLQLGIDAVVELDLGVEGGEDGSDFLLGF
jgi:hypothetical protein